MQAEIITIGDEILIGQIVDTNSQWIAQQFNKIGISIFQISSIQDEKNQIEETLALAQTRSNIIIITGGLGPTNDDITKHTLCDYFEDELVFNQEVFDHIKNLFKKYLKVEVSELNRQQAFLPSRSTYLKNQLGTAPGMWFEKNGKIVVSLPGVPYEMKNIVEFELIPKIQSTFKLPHIIHKTIHTYGLGESSLAERLIDWENGFPENLKLAYLPNKGKVRLRISAKGNDLSELKKKVQERIDSLLPLIKDIYVGVENSNSLEDSIAIQMVNQNLTLSTAESCTGGNIAKLVTARSGASKFFKGGVVVYNKELKINLLNVNEETIDEFSVVSKEVAIEMAKNSRKLMNSDFSIATTGNAGPTKDKTDQSIGVVFIAVASKNHVEIQEFNFGQPREKVIQKASLAALKILEKEISKNSL